MANVNRSRLRPANGLYPTLSANGLVQNNVSYGSLDTSLWVAGSENVRVIGNDLSAQGRETFRGVIRLSRHDAEAAGMHDASR